MNRLAYKEQTFNPHSHGGCKSKVKVQIRWPVRVCFQAHRHWSSSHPLRVAGVREISLRSLLWGHSSHSFGEALMTCSPPKRLTSKHHPIGGQVLIDKFWGGYEHSVHSRTPISFSMYLLFICPPMPNCNSAFSPNIFRRLRYLVIVVFLERHLWNLFHLLQPASESRSNYSTITPFLPPPPGLIFLPSC